MFVRWEVDSVKDDDQVTVSGPLSEKNVDLWKTRKFVASGRYWSFKCGL